MKRPKSTRKSVAKVEPAVTVKSEKYNFTGWIPEFLKMLAAGLIASIATAWGSTLDYWNHNRELDIRMVDVGLIILSGQNEGTKSQHARLYALDLLERYGDMPIKNKELWALNGELPVGKFPSWSPGYQDSLLERYLGPAMKEQVQRQTKSDLME